MKLLSWHSSRLLLWTACFVLAACESPEYYPDDDETISIGEAPPSYNSTDESFNVYVNVKMGEDTTCDYTWARLIITNTDENYLCSTNWKQVARADTSSSVTLRWGGAWTRSSYSSVRILAELFRFYGDYEFEISVFSDPVGMEMHPMTTSRNRTIEVDIWKDIDTWDNAGFDQYEEGWHVLQQAFAPTDRKIEIGGETEIDEYAYIDVSDLDEIQYLFESNQTGFEHYYIAVVNGLYDGSNGGDENNLNWSHATSVGHVDDPLGYTGILIGDGNIIDVKDNLSIAYYKELDEGYIIKSNGAEYISDEMILGAACVHELGHYVGHLKYHDSFNVNTQYCIMNFFPGAGRQVDKQSTFTQPNPHFCDMHVDTLDNSDN